jgi:hypothetical protein
MYRIPVEVADTLVVVHEHVVEEDVLVIHYYRPIGRS